MTPRRGSTAATEPVGTGTVLWVGDPGDTGDAGARLESAGWNLRVVDSGDPSLDDADCVVVAHAPPSVDAREVLDRIGNRTNTPTVVFATDGSEALAGEVVAAGAAGYVPADGPGAAATLVDRLAALQSEDRHGQRPETQQALAESERRFRQIVDNTSDIIWLATSDFSETLYINRAYEELGYTLEEFNDDPLAYMRSIHPDDREQELDAVEQLREWAAAGDAPDEYRDSYRMYDADGNLRWMNEVSFPIRDEEGEVVRWAGIITDITEHKRQEEELRRQNERLEEFASVVSHDLRNPLNVAQGRVALARETGDDAHLAATERALDRMDGLIDGLLTVAREGGKVSDPEPVALDDVVAAAWGLTAHGDGQLVTDPDLGTVDADHERLQRLFENLFRNAVEHATTGTQAGDGDGTERDSPGVTVRVGRLSPDESGCSTGFYVEDDGPGIPVDLRERVFEKGVTGSEGTGFGLAIVSEIVAAHGWSISLTSSADGGARFEVRTTG